MSKFWNEKFAGKTYKYGVQPNAQLKEFLDNAKLNTILFPGEGEGRNAVYAAKLGFAVSAFDTSDVAIEKATQLASEHNVSLHYQLGDIDSLSYEPESFDAIAMVFFHLSKYDRKLIYSHLKNLLKPNGKVFIVGFSQQQLTNGYSSGGPKDLDMLFTEDILKENFQDFSIKQCKTIETSLFEGEGHQGKASLVILEAVKL